MNRTPEELYDVTTGARLYTVREAARILGYHPFSVYRLVCRGMLRHRRLGPKTLLFAREDLLRYQEQARRDPPTRGKPSQAPAAAPALTAEVQVALGSQGTYEAVDEGPQQQFRWENIPLIRARMDSRFGKRLKGLRISVRGREGEAWKVIYSAPRT